MTEELPIIDETQSKITAIVHFGEIVELEPGAAGINRTTRDHIIEGIDKIIAGANEQDKAVIPESLRVTPAKGSSWGPGDKYGRGTFHVSMELLDKDTWALQQPRYKDS